MDSHLTPDFSFVFTVAAVSIICAFPYKYLSSRPHPHYERGRKCYNLRAKQFLLCKGLQPDLEAEREAGHFQVP
jgi:hypothetical protein